MKYVYLVLAVATFSLPVFANMFTGEGFYSLDHEIAVVSYEDAASCAADNGRWSKEDEVCFFAASNDVEVSVRLDGKTNVRVSTISTNFHTCDFEGFGNWDESGALVAKGEVDSSTNEQCEVKLQFVNENEVNVTSNEKCSYYCGANAGLEFSGAKRTNPKPQEK